MFVFIILKKNSTSQLIIIFTLDWRNRNKWHRNFIINNVPIEKERSTLMTNIFTLPKSALISTSIVLILIARNRYCHWYELNNSIFKQLIYMWLPTSQSVDICKRRAFNWNKRKWKKTIYLCREFQFRYEILLSVAICTDQGQTFWFLFARDELSCARIKTIEQK